jgi:hypothetical protein
MTDPYAIEKINKKILPQAIDYEGLRADVRINGQFLELS